ncbi:MAG: hypothetical protein JO181_10515 [Solirubrobacterales bacterium]|nr:hypothetical protein [Solirubrobacterales bacterium]
MAEQPELHLPPHIEAWSQRDERLALIGDHTDDTGAYILDLEWGGGVAVRGRHRELAPDAKFEPHGHVLVIDVTGVL